MLLDLLVPLRCAACGAAASGALCDACRRLAAGLVLADGGWEVLAPRVGAVGVYAYQGVVRDAVQGLKIGGRHAAAHGFSAQVVAHPSVPRGWTVTWVPSTRRRLRQRGFDVPRLLAGPGARPLLRRTVERPDQTTLDAAARRRSPVGAFEALGRPPAEVVLVDDVRTTGATALAAAQALLTAGAARVLVTTLAVGGDDARGGSGANGRP